ncbi:sulfite exporter TauE/SafE family protein [Mesorhizobium sp. CAU 1732]|uniref:sulfite exporter TauE/SafE family protein n=1 Tax=Mesorhizobium sp. CAU 1732 TaxID=3140358 RepID=UPI003261626D
MTIDPAQFLLVFICLALGGVLKGATGAGAPILAVPALAAVFDVKLAVVIMMMPNLLTNLWQGWQHRTHRLTGHLGWIFAAAGAAGALAGTFMLAWLPHETLSIIVALAVLGYVMIRLSRPGWTLSRRAGSRLAAPAGLVAGILQGSSGISAPVSITFLNAMRLERHAYIFTISTFFVAMTVVQIPALGYVGILSLPLITLSLAAVVPILAFMPVGAALARRLSPAAFDRAILLLLVGLALKLVYEAVPFASG